MYHNSSPTIELKDFSRQLASVASEPGVYLFKDDQGQILYVGKASNLKKRVASYFQKSRPLDPKTTLLLSKAADFETIITRTEKEALILESNLIKRHRPRYNLDLKDDKRYPSLCLNITQPYPRLTIVRKIQNDGTLYFGPYTSSQAVKQTLKFIHKTFKLRKCRNKTFMNRTRPCLNYQMALCLGPCCMDVPTELYQDVVKEVIAFLHGRTPELIRKVKQQMAAAADQQDFEQAAVLRDKMFALQKTLEQQVAVISDFKDRDVIALAEDQGITVIVLLRVRSGFLLGSRQFYFDHALGTHGDQTNAFIRQYYEIQNQIPPEILVSHQPADWGVLQDYLSEKQGRKVNIRAPQRGDKAKLVQMALQNVNNALRERIRELRTHHDLLKRLQKKLDMVQLPTRIECFDNSNIAGKVPVAAMAVLVNGQPQPSAYRRYKIHFTGKPDDYAYMTEVLQRRFSKERLDQGLPDLLLLDGGKGQLNVALSVLKDLGLDGRFQVAGIAKPDKQRGEQTDKIYLPNRSNPVGLASDTDLLLLLQLIRDEAHRWAVSYHRKRRGKDALHSKLDKVSGIGPKRKALLLQQFKSIEKIRAATVDELSKLPGISLKTARVVKVALQNEYKSSQKTDFGSRSPP